jgi:protein-tyrosine phosphatase
VLFVCTGNICRSPTAEGVFRKLAADAGLARSFAIDSAGTHSYHVGAAPDIRSIEAAERRGYDLAASRARKLSKEDFARFDLLLAMDDDHYLILDRLRPAGARAQVQRMLEFGSDRTQLEVPDPYYGGPQGFERVLDLIEDAARGLLDKLRADFSAP